MANQRTVPIVDKSHTIHSFDPRTLQPLEVGTAQVRMYQGESVFRNTALHPYETEEKSFKPTKNEWIPFDHQDALAPLLDRGWEITKMATNRGGFNGVFQLTRPNGLRWDDLFTADQDIWGADVGQKDGLMEMIQVRHNISPGGYAVYDRGFYRLVCTNGMVRKELELGHMRMNASNFDEAELVEEMLNPPVITEDMILGDVAGTPKGARQFAEFIERQYLDPEANAHLPKVAKKMAKPFESIPSWVGLNAIAQFYAIAEQKRDVREMELMNAWTGAINQPDEEGDSRSRVGVLNKVQSLTEASSNLMGVFSL